MHVFCIFVFAPVQCILACFTRKGALEIRSVVVVAVVVVAAAAAAAATAAAAVVVLE